MPDSVTSAFSEVSEKTFSIFGDSNRIVFIGLVVLLFLIINNIVIYILYVKLRRTINSYCDNNRLKKLNK